MRGYAIAASGLFLGIWLSLSGCKPLEFGANPRGVDTGSDTTGSAILNITDSLQRNAGALTFHLYSSTAQNIQDAPIAKTLGKVGLNQTARFPVPAGKWKIGYATEGGDFRSMPPDTLEETNSADWPVAVFEKNEAYRLLIYTDEGNATVWRSDLVSAPR